MSRPLARLGALLLAGLLQLATPARAQTEPAPAPVPGPTAMAGDIHPVSGYIAEHGLARADAMLSLQAAFNFGKASQVDFLLGGVRFLRAVEAGLQVRWQSNVSGPDFLPGLRAPIPANPDARPFEAGDVAGVFEAMLASLAEARSPLEEAVNGRDFAAVIDLDDLWFDIDGDGARAKFESAAALLGVTGFDRVARGSEFSGVVRFDSADADWLLAYVHLLSGVSQTVLALEPTPAIERVMSARADMLELTGGAEARLYDFVEQDWIDTAASVLWTLEGTPDAARSAAAHAHFKAMIAHNRSFWAKVEQESDNDREWLPNGAQVSAFGLEIPAGVASQWQAVLGELEAVLDGEILVPYWRTSPQGGEDSAIGIGLNLRKLFEQPGEMDLVGWLQGANAVPYLERGPLTRMDSLRQFGNMVRGDSLFFVLWLN